MTQPSRFNRAASAALLAAVALAGCSTDGGGAGTPAVVVVDGSSTVYRISKTAGEAYRQENPATTVVVEYHSTGAGFARYLSGALDVVGASRAARPEEEAEADRAGRPWSRFLVGYDGVTVVVNPANDFVEALSVDQLRRLFEPDSTVKNWKDLDPAWPDRPIELYGPDDESGTFDFFTEAVVGEAGSQRADVESSADDTALVTDVVGDPDGLAYFGYGYYDANARRLRALPIRAADDRPAVAPSPETILDKSYAPLARPLYIYVKQSSLARPEVEYYLDNVVSLARTSGYVAPSEADRAVNATTLAEAIRLSAPPGR